MPKQVRADLALLEVGKEDAVDTARQQPCQVGLSHRERQPADVLAIADEDVEGVELHLGVMLAAVQAVEIGPAVDAGQHGLAIDHELAVAVAQRSLGDQREATAPDQINAVLTQLAGQFPQTFVPEKHLPHRPLKVGIAGDIQERCEGLDRRVLGVALRGREGAEGQAGIEPEIGATSVARISCIKCPAKAARCRLENQK